jgi:hypothetical protein
VDILTIIATVFRRWYVTVPILALTLVVAYRVQESVPPEFEVGGSVLLEEPRFDPSRLPATTANADVLVQRLINADADVTVEGAELEAQSTDASTIELTATATAAQTAEATVENALEWLRADADGLQEAEGIPVADRVRGLVLTPTITAEPTDDTFVASGTLFLQDPAADVTNPYRADSQTGRLLREVITSDQARAAIAGRTGSGVQYTVGVPREAEAILNIGLSGPDPEALLDGFNVVREALNEELDARQARADVPEPRRILVVPLATPQSWTDVSPPLSRAVAAIVGAGGLLALGLAIGMESFLSRRSSRRTNDEFPDELVPVDLAGDDSFLDHEVSSVDWENERRYQ